MTLNQSEQYVNILSYREFVRKGNWVEGKANTDGLWIEEEVSGEIWSDAIQNALDQNTLVYIPSSFVPVYIDKPIILNSGNCLKLEKETEIRLKPRTNTCMIRNSNMICVPDDSVNPSFKRDKDILVEGGIWNAMNNGMAGGNGNVCGNSDVEKKIYGAHGNFLFNNVQNLTVRNAIIKECTSFAIHVSACSEFLIENIHFPRIYRDGVHVNGPAENGIIRNISGKSGDDIIAVNAWDWLNCTMTFGPIRNILVEDIASEPGYLWSEIRILAGTKLFENGNRFDCDIRNCTFKRLKGIHTVKMYSQPNHEVGIDKDYSPTVGYLEDFHFEDLETDYIKPDNYYCKKGGVFEVCSDVQDLEIKNVKVNFPLTEEKYGDLKLVAVGPLSGTWKYDKLDTSKWVEIFEPDSVCTVSGLKISDVYHKTEFDQEYYTPCNDASKLVVIRKQQVNPNYPNTIPRGGTGYGVIMDIDIL